MFFCLSHDMKNFKLSVTSKVLGKRCKTHWYIRSHMRNLWEHVAQFFFSHLFVLTLVSFSSMLSFGMKIEFNLPIICQSTRLLAHSPSMNLKGSKCLLLAIPFDFSREFWLCNSKNCKNTEKSFRKTAKTNRNRNNFIELLSITVEIQFHTPLGRMTLKCKLKLFASFEYFEKAKKIFANLSFEKWSAKKRINLICRSLSCTNSYIQHQLITWSLNCNRWSLKSTLRLVIRL